MKSPNSSEIDLTKEIYKVMQIPYLSERHDAIKALIDQQTQAARIEQWQELISAVNRSQSEGADAITTKAIIRVATNHIKHLKANTGESE